MKKQLRHIVKHIAAFAILCFASCQSQSGDSQTSGIASAISGLGSEVETNGVKSRLFGCLPDDRDCLKRSELTAKLECDFITNEQCAGCSKMDLSCLEKAVVSAKVPEAVKAEGT